MIEVLKIIYMVLFYCTFVFVAYNLILMVIGLLPRKRKYKIIEDSQKFCIFVPCHNEGSVIGATVENLSKIVYDRDLFDVYFIADNCSDNTADEIRKAIKELGTSNFNCFERHVDDPKKKGKPHALKWAIEKLEEEDKFYNKYDMFMILDADNFVDADILKHMNSQYLSYPEKKRPELIQCYLDSKNKNSIIARGYYTTYRIMNGFWQYPKTRIGLNACIGGTGFSMTTKFLKEIGGYNCSSLTEDLEIQTIATLKNRRILFNQFARIYDEKPTGLKQSMVQRTRWAQGHWFICFKYTWRLFLSLFNFKQIKMIFKKLDNMLYLLGMFNITCTFLMLLINLGISISNAIYKIWGIGELYEFNVIPPTLYTVSIISSIVFYCIILLSSIYDGDKKEKKFALLEVIPNIISLLIFSFTYFPPAIIGLFKCPNQKTWKKTAHKVTKIAHKDNLLLQDENTKTEEISEELKMEDVSNN